MPDEEPVLQLGVEGGGATIFRSPLGSGGWEYHVEGSSMDFDEIDDEVWRSWRSGPFTAVAEALETIAKDGSWVCFYPVKVHSEYREAVWRLAQEVATRLTEDRRRSWDRRKPDWQRRCLVLVRVIGGRGHVLAQVSLRQLLWLPGTNQSNPGRSTWQNKIAAKSVDFVVSDPATLRPLVVIELDEPTHARPARQDRDEDVETMLRAAGLPYLRVLTSRTYDTRELAAVVAPYLARP